MIKVRFKNLEVSEVAREVTLERLQAILDKFPGLKSTQLSATLEMLNSPLQAGPDLFKVKILIQGGKYGGIVLEKSAASLYVALAEVVEHALERLNRFGDKTRVKRISSGRRLLHKIDSPA